MTYKQSKHLERQYISEYEEKHGFNATYKFVSSKHFLNANSIDHQTDYLGTLDEQPAG